MTTRDTDKTHELVKDTYTRAIESHDGGGCCGGAISETAYLDGLRAAGLTDVRVVDRLVYEPRQVVEMVANDFPDIDRPLIDRALPFVEGKVASIRVTGRRA
jgi:hypothetical protein